MATYTCWNAIWTIVAILAVLRPTWGHRTTEQELSIHAYHQYLKTRSSSVVQESECPSVLVLDNDPNRIPSEIARVACHADAGDHCVQLELPIQVSFIRPESARKPKLSSQDLDRTEVIRVASGCFARGRSPRSNSSSTSLRH